MKVRMETRSEEEMEECDYRDEIVIFINDKRVFRVRDDEPEDSNLGRSFSDCYNIVDLMHQAYLAGKNGEEFDIL